MSEYRYKDVNSILNVLGSEGSRMYSFLGASIKSYLRLSSEHANEILFV